MARARVRPTGMDRKVPYSLYRWAATARSRYVMYLHVRYGMRRVPSQCRSVSQRMIPVCVVSTKQGARVWHS